MLGEWPADSINDSTCASEKEFSINFIKVKTKFCLSIYDNGDEI